MKMNEIIKLYKNTINKAQIRYRLDKKKVY